MGVPGLAVLLFAFRLGSQLGGDLLLDRAGFVVLVGGAKEVDGHFGFNRKVGDALLAWRYQRRPLIEVGSNHIQNGVRWR